MNLFKNLIKRCPKVVFIKNSTLLRFEKKSEYIQDLNKKFSRHSDLLNEIISSHEGRRLEILENLIYSKSQLWQDIYVLSHLGFKRNGYFVEFGASDGVRFSNTHLLEKRFGWHGILAEPAKCWHASLLKNRQSNIEKSAVYSLTGENLLFNETNVRELATLDSYSSADFHSGKRKPGNKYFLKTISLLDLLEKYEAPKEIDYLSIDTEGSEYEIIRNFDFQKYSFKIITCEHNFSDYRENIFSLLTSNGYNRVFYSENAFEDWYCRG